MSADELLDVGESLSPLAEWKKRNGLVTVMEDPAIVGVEPGTFPFYCMRDAGTPSQDYHKIGHGDCEESACLDFCSRNNLHHWHL